MAGVSTMVNAISFLWLKRWHAPAGRRTCEPRPLAQDTQIRPAPPVGATKTWDPAGRSFRRTTRTAPADSEIRPVPRATNPRPQRAYGLGTTPGRILHILPPQVRR